MTDSDAAPDTQPHPQPAPDPFAAIKLNGATVHYSDDCSTIFLPLPRELWQPTRALCAGRCVCQFCLANPDLTPSWDTLAFKAKPDKGRRSDTAWMVHRPAEHPVNVLRRKRPCCAEPKPAGVHDRYCANCDADLPS